MLFPLLSGKQSCLEQRLIQACSLTPLWLIYGAPDGVNVHKLTVALLFQRDSFKKQREQPVRLLVASSHNFLLRKTSLSVDTIQEEWHRILLTFILMERCQSDLCSHCSSGSEEVSSIRLCAW